MRYGLIEWYCLKNCVMSTIRSRMTGSPGSGFRTIGSLSVLMLVRHARPFLPLMFIASEPHTPSRHERLKLRLGSIAFSFISASSSMRSLPSSSTCDRLHRRRRAVLGVVAVDAEACAGSVAVAARRRRRPESEGVGGGGCGFLFHGQKVRTLGGIDSTVCGFRLTGL